MAVAPKVVALKAAASVVHQKVRVVPKVDLPVVKVALTAAQKVVPKVDLLAMAKGKDAPPKVAADLAKPLPDSAHSFNS